MTTGLKILMFTTLCWIPSALFGQSAERKVIGSLGGFTETTSYQVSYTVGETVITTGVSSNVIVTQGFQQPEATKVGVKELEQALSVNVYPNPVLDEVGIEIRTTSSLNLSIDIYDMLGKATGISVENLYVNGEEQLKLNVNDLPVGQYFILFSSENSTMGTVQIQKLN